MKIDSDERIIDGDGMRKNYLTFSGDIFRVILGNFWVTKRTFPMQKDFPYFSYKSSWKKLIRTKNIFTSVR